MGEEKEKIQQTGIGQGKDKFETIGTLLSVVALSIFFGFILMAIATTVENSVKSILSIISSIMFTVAAIVIIADIVIKQIHHQKNVKKKVLSVFSILFIALCTGILIVSGINTVYKKEILNDIIYWLVAAVMIVVSIAVITLQFLINKNDFEQNPIKSYAVIILTMLYALTYAMIVKPDIVFNIAFTIHTMASLVVFINIIFKTGIKSKNIIQLALFVIAVLALMAQMIYSIYIWFFNPIYPDLFNAIMGVFAGLLGGVLTLTGVAWTIKRQDEIRKEDEKRKIKPYIVIVKETFNKTDVKKLCFASIDGYGKIGEDKTYILDERFLIKNVGVAACVLAYIKINGKKQNCVMQSLVVNENALVCSVHKKNLIKITEDRLLEIKLGIYDVNYNLYEYNVVFRTSLHPFKYESINESEKIYYIKSDNDTFYSKGIAVDYIDCSSDSIKENIREYKDRPLEEMVEDMKKITGDKNDNN